MALKPRRRNRPSRGSIGRQRRRTLTVKELLKYKKQGPRIPFVLCSELPDAADITAEELGPRPRFRHQCAGGPRPCPWVGCRYHFFLEERTHRGGGLVFNWPDREPWEIPETCSLDVCDNAHTLEETGAFLNLTRERIRQVEFAALLKIKLEILANFPQIELAYTEPNHD